MGRALLYFTLIAMVLAGGGYYLLLESEKNAAEERRKQKAAREAWSRSAIDLKELRFSGVHLKDRSYGPFMALDGVVQDPQNWHFPYFNDEMGVAVSAQLGNADTIRSDTEGVEHVVVIGGSYIGTEVAASLTLLGRSVTILMQEDVTHERSFGAQAGRYFQSVLEEHDIEVVGGDGLARFEGDGDRVTKVVTERGRELPAGAVVIGAGAVPDTTLAKQADEKPRLQAPRLTTRELEVLKLVAQGMSNRDVAEALFIAENTVKNHVRNILEKLQLHSRMEAVVYAVREKILDIN